MMISFYKISPLVISFGTIIALTAAQTKEKLESTNDIVELPDTQDSNVTLELTGVLKKNSNKDKEMLVQKQDAVADTGLSIKIYRLVTDPIAKVVSLPKVNEVLRNIGTCIVNGALELVSFYLPPAFMPLIASAAGLVIPFEPVVMLKERMPVTSYRRAFNTAMNSFLKTFDKYKVEEEFDPYMTRRFNRRFMDDNEKKKENLI